MIRSRQLDNIGPLNTRPDGRGEPILAMGNLGDDRRHMQTQNALESTVHFCSLRSGIQKALPPSASHSASVHIADKRATLENEREEHPIEVGQAIASLGLVASESATLPRISRAAVPTLERLPVVLR